MGDKLDMQVCRTCLRVNDKAKISLFKKIELKSSNEMELSKMISELTKIKYKPDTRLPEVVCLTCVSDICRAYFFRRNCIKSEQALKKKFNLRVEFETEQASGTKIGFISEDDDNEEDIDPDPSTSNFDDHFMDNDEDNDDDDADPDWNAPLIDLKPENINIKDELMFESIDGPGRSTDDLPLMEVKCETQLDTSDKADTGGVDGSNENAPLLDLLNGETNKDFIYRCQFCENKYTCFSSLGKHRRKKHPEHLANFKRKIDYYNDYLQSQGVDEYALDREGREGTSKRPAIFQCQFCQDKFVTMFHLKKHTRMNHVDETGNPNKVLCDICGKAIFKSSLELHKRSHSDERPFPCDICGKTFTALIYLNDHRRRHTEKVSFFCDVCNKGFTRKRGLVDHKKRHTGIKPHECNICQRRFLSKSRCQLHIRTHFGEVPYREIEKRRPKRIRKRKPKNPEAPPPPSSEGDQIIGGMTAEPSELSLEEF